MLSPPLIFLLFNFQCSFCLHLRSSGRLCKRKPPGVAHSGAIRSSYARKWFCGFVVVSDRFRFLWRWLVGFCSRGGPNNMVRRWRCWTTSTSFGPRCLAHLLKQSRKKTPQTTQTHRTTPVGRPKPPPNHLTTICSSSAGRHPAHTQTHTNELRISAPLWATTRDGPSPDGPSSVATTARGAWPHPIGPAGSSAVTRVVERARLTSTGCPSPHPVELDTSLPPTPPNLAVVFETSGRPHDPPDATKTNLGPLSVCPLWGRVAAICGQLLAKSAMSGLFGVGVFPCLAHLATPSFLTS